MEPMEQRVTEEQLDRRLRQIDLGSRVREGYVEDQPNPGRGALYIEREAVQPR